jgi:hypothetical protein
MQNQQNINELTSQEIARTLGQSMISNIQLQVALQSLSLELAELKKDEPKE